MAVFLAYAFTIKNMEPVDGRESGPGANTPGCQLQEPSTVQTGLLITLAIMTVDFLVQEMRQVSAAPNVILLSVRQPALPVASPCFLSPLLHMPTAHVPPMQRFLE